MFRIELNNQKNIVNKTTKTKTPPTRIALWDWVIRRIVYSAGKRWSKQVSKYNNQFSIIMISLQDSLVKLQ